MQFGPDPVTKLIGFPLINMPAGYPCRSWACPPIAAGEPQPTIAWGTKREVFLVMGLASSRTDRPHGLPAAIHEPSTT